MSKYPRLIHISVTPDFKPGDPEPVGYCDWHEWARVQYKAGLRQLYCTQCSKWQFPHVVCCGGERITAKEIKRVERQAKAYVRKNYPSAEKKYQQELRKQEQPHD